jgi:predicted nucleic acid-binding protein
MPQKYDAVLADASCFILLDKIGELEILQKVFGTITTANEVALEFGKPLPAWIVILQLEKTRYKELLSIEVDEGEAAVMALAFQMKNALLILDDYKARKVAEKLGLQYTGTLGVFLKAKELGVLNSVRIMLDKVQKTNFRFSELLLNDILREAGEI